MIEAGGEIYKSRLILGINLLFLLISIGCENWMCTWKICMFFSSSLYSEWPVHQMAFRTVGESKTSEWWRKASKQANERARTRSLETKKVRSLPSVLHYNLSIMQLQPLCCAFVWIQLWKYFFWLCASKNLSWSTFWVEKFVCFCPKIAFLSFIVGL